jgi:uncharacterized delta-60 repeat protein
VAIQADGKIVADGRARFTDFALARYEVDGSLDTSLTGDGKQRTDFGGPDRANGVTLQDDGKIVAAGFGGGTDDFALARYNPNGTLDASFSRNGKQTTDFGGPDGASAMALQADGKIVAVGFADVTGNDNDFALARYNPDGSLDPSFSGDGKQTTDFGGRFDGATAAALQGDGKIVVVGSGGPNGNDFALARYNSAGGLDTSFSGDGKETTGFSGGGRGVAIQPNGKFVVVGGNGGIFALARYNLDGSLDTSFSSDGKQETSFGGAAFANGVAIQANGKIVAVGNTYDTTTDHTDFALAQYNPNGSLDSTFSGDGKQTTDFGTDDGAAGVELQGDGKIVAAGTGGDFDAPSSNDFALARYNPDGSLDSSFSGDGKQTTDFAGGPDGAAGLALQGDGRIVAVGNARFSVFSLTRDFALARYNPDGSLDTSFSGDGRQTTNFGPVDQADGVALQGDGKIVVAGIGRRPDQASFTSDFAAVRYLGG